VIWKALLVTAALVAVVVIVVFMAWKLGYISFYSYTIKN
jgi:hypothetical protein